MFSPLVFCGSSDAEGEWRKPCSKRHHNPLNLRPERWLILTGHKQLFLPDGLAFKSRSNGG